MVRKKYTELANRSLEGLSGRFPRMTKAAPMLVGFLARHNQCSFFQRIIALKHCLFILGFHSIRTETMCLARKPPNKIKNRIEIRCNHLPNALAKAGAFFVKIAKAFY